MIRALIDLDIVFMVTNAVIAVIVMLLYYHTVMVTIQCGDGTRRCRHQQPGKTIICAASHGPIFADIEAGALLSLLETAVEATVAGAVVRNEMWL